MTTNNGIVFAAPNHVLFNTVMNKDGRPTVSGIYSDKWQIKSVAARFFVRSEKVRTIEIQVCERGDS